MPRIKKRKCRHCCELSVPDPRNATRQRYCSKPQCRKASKAASQKRWLQKEENHDQFCGPVNVQRVQHWRKEHPGYWRRGKAVAVALQDPLTEQRSVNIDDNDDFTHPALQDLLIIQPAVLIGLIAQLTGYALQDDIALAARRMQQLGNDILNPQLKGGRHDKKTSAVPRTGAQNPQTVQLDRSAPLARDPPARAPEEQGLAAPFGRNRLDLPADVIAAVTGSQLLVILEHIIAQILRRVVAGSWRRPP